MNDFLKDPSKGTLFAPTLFKKYQQDKKKIETKQTNKKTKESWWWNYEGASVYTWGRKWGTNINL